MKRIHIVHTGGTIGSMRTDEGTIDLIDVPHATKTSGECIFTESSPYHILSENMTPKYWNLLISHVKELDLSELDALFITHGTDTLAYTANLFALLFKDSGIPIFFISSHRPLEDPIANGHDNMAAAIESTLKMDVKRTLKRNVFVPYRSMKGIMKVHAGEKIMQSGDFSNDFYSIKDETINDLDAVISQLKKESMISSSHNIQSDLPLYKTAGEISANILAIRPYPGIDYEAFDVTKPRAILHGTYHSFTATDESSGSGSLIEFAKRAAAAGKKVYIAPMSSSSDKRYATLANLTNCEEIIPLYDMSFEMAYAYLSLLK